MTVIMTIDRIPMHRLVALQIVPNSRWIVDDCYRVDFGPLDATWVTNYLNERVQNGTIKSWKQA